MTPTDTPGILTRRIEVPSSAIDANGHVNNVVFVQWMQDVAIQHANDSGATAAARDDGATWFARSHHIEYLRPAYVGEVIEAATCIVTAKRATSTRRYRFTRLSDGVVLAQGETEWVYVCAETGRPRSIPESVRLCFPLADLG
ncbi:acyl-CoAthioester hydrolase [Terrimicrobium sacchariphilum]|uniref:Acyl-CoAthioester hydrolase n=1 Tax=Terrimicrobium sacchariphilum TaxID=690879 RepID=A0A146GCM1_TERSA|nr:thioesterase family protein [Terrimicrobium sacchariphilum]GAT34437.1 acyl-CoAthioester hydrolase [Terrimicrobium sacchariphilum]